MIPGDHPTPGPVQKTVEADHHQAPGAVHGHPGPHQERHLQLHGQRCHGGCWSLRTGWWVNRDTVSVDIQQKINQLNGTPGSDTEGDPYVQKMNPSMLTECQVARPCPYDGKDITQPVRTSSTGHPVPQAGGHHRAVAAGHRQRHGGASAPCEFLSQKKLECLCPSGCPDAIAKQS